MLKKAKFYIKKISKDTLIQLASLGSYQFYIIIVIFFFLYARYNESKILFFGLVLLYLTAIPIRLMFFRERPIPKPYSNLIEKINASSMPSLHIARSTFLVLFFSNFFAENKMIDLFLIILVIIIACSRIYNKRHYISDIVAGVILGIFVWAIISLIGLNINFF